MYDYMKPLYDFKISIKQNQFITGATFALRFANARHFTS